jgi:hypothetical protein
LYDADLVKTPPRWALRSGDDLPQQLPPWEGTQYGQRHYARRRAQAQAASAPRRRRFHIELPPIDPALRKRRIRIARVVNLICRTKCDCTIAARACGLSDDSKALQVIKDRLDFRRIPRRGNGIVWMPETPSRVFEEFIPRQERRAENRPVRTGQLAEMVAELREITDPLGDGEPAEQKPKPIATCAGCGTCFEGRAKFCGVRCRVRDWRSRG